MRILIPKMAVLYSRSLYFIIVIILNFIARIFDMVESSRNEIKVFQKVNESFVNGHGKL